MPALVASIPLRTARLCQFIGIARISPAITASLKLLHLSEFQFNRRSAAEDRYGDLHARAAFVDFLDNTVEGSERSIRHAHLFADFERNRRLRSLDAFLHLVQDAVSLRVRNRHRFLFTPEKAGD